MDLEVVLSLPLRGSSCFAGPTGGRVRPCPVFYSLKTLSCPAGSDLAFSLSLRDDFVLPVRRVARCGLALFSTPWRLFLARRVRGQATLFHCVRLFVAPRAGSGRSGCASSAALRPASACDRAGTDRHADPRCSPPSHETLGRVQRLHPPVWPLGARTLRRHGSSRPRGGSHHHPHSRMKRSRGPATEQPGPDFNVSSRRVGVSNRPAGATGHTSGGCGYPARGSGWGIGDAASCGHRGDPGPRRAAGSQPKESWRAASGGEQAPRGRALAGQKKASRSEKEEADRSEPAGQRKKPSRSDNEETSRAPAGQDKGRHAVKKGQAPCNSRSARMCGRPAASIRLRAASTL